MNARQDAIGRSPDRRAGSRWLQNMSCRPSATIVHEGKDLCRRLLFAMPAEPRPASTRFADLCVPFGLQAPSDRDGYRVLMEFIREPCPRLAALPAIAAAERTMRGVALPGFTDDPRLVLAVLSRSTGSVFLRDREPSLTSDQIQKPVVLLLPPTWKEPA